jgi:hypothetical protein
LLIFRVGTFEVRGTVDTLIAGAGGLLMAVWLARLFGEIYSRK